MKTLSAKPARAALIGALVSAAAFAAACGSDSPDAQGGSASAGNDKHVVGAILPLSGPYAADGAITSSGAKLAVEDANAEFPDANIKLQLDDGQADPQTSVTALQKEIADGVPAVVSGVSTIILAMLPVAQQNKVILANAAAQSPALQSAGDGWLFNFVPSSDQEQTALAQTAIKCGGYKRAAILVVDSDFGKGAAGAFTPAFEEAGGEVVATERYPAGATKFTDELRKIAAAKPDVLMLAGNTGEIGNAIKQNHTLGYDLPLLGGSVGTLAGDNLKIAGETIVGMHVAGLQVPDTPEAEKFAARFEEKFGETPGSTQIPTYDAMRMVAEAYAKVGSDAEKVAEYLKSSPGYEGIMGTYKFDGGTNNKSLPIATSTITDAKGTLEPWSC